jgi:hypothetical protein
MGIEKVGPFPVSEKDLIADSRLFIADALLGKTFFAGLRWEPDILASRCEPRISLLRPPYVNLADECRPSIQSTCSKRIV